MRLIPSPTRHQESWHEELDAALRGEDHGPVAGGWRELCEDVRTLTPPMSAEFERLLAERLSEWTAETPRTEEEPSTQTVRRALLRPLPAFGRPRTVGLAGAVGALVATCVIAVSLWGGTGATHVAPLRGPAKPALSSSASTPSSATAGSALAPAPKVSASAAAKSSTPANAQTGGQGTISAPGRVQQLAASIALSSSPDGVQSIAEQVARLAVRDGGYVQSSQVQQQAQGASEATLDLQLPSAKLSTALASIGQLAAVRAESQSSQDITSAYDGARRGLADAVAERGALLKALSRATTQGQIESLREQLSLAASAVTRARSAVQALSRQVSSSALEVTVLGDARAGSEGLTLKRGLHDAGHVLTIALVVLLISIAVLIPLAVLLVALIFARRAWRRHLRERTLA
jgi:hypothetical protein